MFKQTTSIIFFFMLLFIFMVAVKFLNISIPVLVTNTSRSTELSVVGEGKVEVIPDTAKVDVGISVQNAATVEAAQTEMDKTN
ncbi:MAG TPA: SIMPL domain-containing protein, partial [Candidatus Woesebacteria bacterium]|nr:SIMPL domain-containing protein [Candidatus Woesebacteria bacterium]